MPVILKASLHLRLSASGISRSRGFINVIRVLDPMVICFGMLTSIVGMDLAALWNLSDLANILIAYCNIPLLLRGFRYVIKAVEHYEKEDGTPFNSETAGIALPVWDEKLD